MTAKCFTEYTSVHAEQRDVTDTCKSAEIMGILGGMGRGHLKRGFKQTQTKIKKALDKELE